jgi:hypothetical protein
MHISPPLEPSILGAIGHTPLIELRRIVEQRGLRGRLLAKLDYLNPGGSMKDRIALQIVRNARPARSRLSARLPDGSRAQGQARTGRSARAHDRGGQQHVQDTLTKAKKMKREPQ